MKIVIGLGNPGDRYAATRHNIGWMVLDAIAEKLGATFRPGRGEYYETEIRWRGVQALLVKPTTYMNNSGIAAGQLVDRHEVAPDDLLAVVDELQFPVGRVQIRPSGSSGGHNGLESLIYHLESDQYPRVRCGIGSDFERGMMADYVLAPFPAEQKELIDGMVQEARDMVLTWIAEGTAKAMSRHNGRPKPARRDNDTNAAGPEAKGSSDEAAS
jgi:PTH1 family peptidyl-tRNA hydrolase